MEIGGLTCLVSACSNQSTNVLKALDREFTILDGALNAFVTEMKAQERWDDVTIVVSSDFGR